jgi:hypothetical protein
MRYTTIILLLLFTASGAAAQSFENQTLAELQRQLDSLLNKPPATEVVLGVSYGNNPAYGGKSTDAFRPLTMKSFLAPHVAYNHKSGLFASAYGYYLLNATQKPWFEMDLNAGYDYTKNRHFISGISYTRYFYADSSDIPATPIKNELFAYFFYRKWWLEPGLSLDFGWGKLKEKVTRRAERTISGNDFNIIADVRHSFLYMDLLKRGDALLLMPVASFTAGTAHYYSNLRSTQYVSRSKFLERWRKRRGQSEEDISVSDKTGFKPRAVDLGLRASYVIGKVTLAPSYTFFKLLQGDDTNITGYFTASLSLTL